MAKGPGNNEEQIRVLEEKLGLDGIEKASDIVDTYTADEIALAFKRSRPNKTKGLPRAVEKLLEKVPDGIRAQTEARLMEAVNA